MSEQINKEWIITILLWFFLGCLGVHRFYNGKVWTGILMIITIGGLGIWWLVDGIIIVVGNFKHKDGTVISIKVKVQDESIKTEL